MSDPQVFEPDSRCHTEATNSPIVWRIRQPLPDSHAESPQGTHTNYTSPYVLLIWLLLVTACSGSEEPDGTPSQVEDQVVSLAAERDRLQQEQLQVETQLASVSLERDELEERLASVAAASDLLQEDVQRIEAELSSTVSDHDLAQEELRRTKAALVSAVSRGDELAVSLAAVEDERDELRVERQDRDARIAHLETELREARASYEQAHEQVTYLLSKYDQEIRENLQAAIDDEIERACTVASATETYETPVTEIVSWQSEWEPIATRAELEVAVEQCAAPERERLADQYRTELAAAVDAEIERACAAAIEEYNDPIGSFPQWDPEWELVMTRLQQIEAVEECAKPERTRRITAEIQSAVDAEIERACSEAIERYRQSVSLFVRWYITWVSVMTRAELIEAVEECAGPERSQLLKEERQAAVDAEIERACVAAIEQYTRQVSEIVQWKPDWEAITTRLELEKAVEGCASPERARLVRADLEAAVDAEIKRACGIAVERLGSSVDSIVRWEPEWKEITTQTRLERAVEECAEDERNRVIEQHRAGRSVPVRDGKFEFTVTGIEQPGREYGVGTLADEAVGTWFVVHLTIENISNVPKTFLSDDQDLIWGNRRYTAEGFTWSTDNHIELNPGLKVEATILFDVPRDFPREGFGTLLELHDSFLSGGVTVQL